MTLEEQIQSNPELIVQAAARKRLRNFARYMFPELVMTDFHKAYYEVLDRFSRGEIKKLIVSCPPQHGKQINDNELVPTPKGFVRHGDLKVGDYVFGRDGQPVKVEWVSPKSESEYVVTFSDGQQIRCHGNHEWVVRNRLHSDKWEQIETKELYSSPLYSGQIGHRGSRYNYHVDSYARVEFDAQEVAIDPYTLGVWLGDGRSDSPCIGIGNGDYEILRHIPYSFSSHWTGENMDYYYFSKQLDLKRYDLVRNKHIPSEYIFNSVEVRKALIAGLIDTDGAMYHGSERITITNTNKAIIDGVRLILNSLGQSVAIHAVPPTTSTSGVVGRKTVYQLCFTPTTSFPIQVERKKIRYLLKKNRLRAIKSIERVEGLGQGNCIQVEGGIYLVGERFVPTHNSQGSSRILPAFLLGLNPDYKIVIGSYNADTAKSFNTDVQKIINSPQYKAVFPDTYLNTERVRIDNVYKCNSEISETVGHSGWLKAVGRSGSLTSRSVDISILDDVYKDFAEASSPQIREQAWKWYTTVVRTRLHNKSQELIVFTRWHEDDLIGRIEKSGEQIIELRYWEDLKHIPEGAWVHLNFPAIKSGYPTEVDPREEGEALWEERHSRENLLAQKALDPSGFECLYQGNPSSAEGRLYEPFKTWIEKSDYGIFCRKGCMIDVADSGKDDLCSITYDVYRSKSMIFNEQSKKYEPLLFALVTDVVFTDEGTKVTSVTVPQQINMQGSQKVWIESNSGGGQFAEQISKKVRANVKKFHQSTNKESKIITNAAFVNNQIIMPYGWETKFPKFYQKVTHFLRAFSANSTDDGPDCLSEIYIKELSNGSAKAYNKQKRGIRRVNG